MNCVNKKGMKKSTVGETVLFFILFLKEGEPIFESAI